MRPIRRVLLAASAAALAAVAGSSFFWGPDALRRVDAFQVRRVEISGTRLLAPHAVLAASSIREGQSVWDDPAAWEDALRAHPAIAAASIRRRLPGTLRVRVEEKRPVALVEDGALRPATAAGEVLPVDPARITVDLPIVRGPRDDAEGRRAVKEVLAELGRLAEMDPALVADVSEARMGEDGEKAVVLSHRLAEIVVPAGMDPGRIAQLRAVLGDLERRGAPEGSPTVARVDLRFRDQIVVSLSSSV